MAMMMIVGNHYDGGRFCSGALQFRCGGQWGGGGPGVLRYKIRPCKNCVAEPTLPDTKKK